MARLETGRGYARIALIDGKRTVTLTGDVDTSVLNAGELIAEMQNEFLPELERDFPEIEVSGEGEVKEGTTTGASLRR